MRHSSKVNQFKRPIKANNRYCLTTDETQGNTDYKQAVIGNK
jgi:hypothetical protein